MSSDILNTTISSVSYTHLDVYKRQRKTRLKFYKVMDVSVLLYGSKTWVPGKKHLSRIQASEVRFLRFKGCTLRDSLYNEDNSKDLKVFDIQDRIAEYKMYGLVI